MLTKSRQRWTDQQVRREPSLYDEWLNEEKKEPPPATAAMNTRFARRHGSTAGLSVASLGTIMPARNETPNAAAVASSDQDRSLSTLRAAQSNARYSSTTTLPLVAAPSTSSSTSSSSLQGSSSRTKRKEQGVRNNGVTTETMPSKRSPNTRMPSSESAKGNRGILGRRPSKGNSGSVQTASSPTPAHDGAASVSSTTRPRTRTLDDHSSTIPTHLQRRRMASVNAASTAPHMRGMEYLASVPAAPAIVPPVTTPIVAPSRSDTPRITTAASAVVNDTDGTSAIPKRILHLMKTLHGRMSGVLIFRRGSQTPWTETYCFIQEESASLVCEARSGDGSHRTLVSELRGCHIEFSRLDEYAPYIVVRAPRSTQEVHLKVQTQSDFDSWIAALLTWHDKGPHREHASLLQPATITPLPTAAIPAAPRRTSAARSISPRSRKRADSDRSQQRRKSVVMSLKEAPVIKIGKMIFWDTDVTYNSSASTVGQPSTERPQAHRMQSYGSRRWRRISVLLRENGELKLHADHDNSLLSVVQLSQLSRCAIQRLDQSVLENEFCIAIYPQYTSTSTDNINIIRPIFLSLESRVLHEVWFVLLRAFTIPQLYGPRILEDFGTEAQDLSRDFEKMLAEQTTDMFRMERALSIRVVEAKLYPVNPNESTSARIPQNARPENFGYHVELLLDNEIRAKTAVKFEGLSPLWGETFDFADLPPVLTSASVVIKRRPPDATRLAQDGRMMFDSKNLYNDSPGAFSGINFDVTCGKVEIYLDELTATNEAERWWPVVNMFNQRVGEVLVKARADEGVVLMARDYQPLNDLLHKFSNGLSLQLAQIVPGELKRLSDCLLNIYQVSGSAGEWIMALVEDEIDSFHRETPITRLRYNGRNDTNDQLGSGGGHSDRELMVRDMNRNATLEANLLFRGNTLLTKSLDSHMRRVGKAFLEDALAAKLKEICERDPDCEVDPNRTSEPEVNRNWRRLIALTSEVWKSIVAAKHKCPIELRRIFRHIRACAEDRYGDFLRSVSYSSVSGFLFLRFFCPAVLNPKLFGLYKEDIKPKGRRTLTLIAKSLQTLANMASFGTKEQWMEPMNIFLNQSREVFKTFIDDICYVPVAFPPKSTTIGSSTTSSSSSMANIKMVSADTHLSYGTPMTIMQRLPPTSREGFPSLPYLIDQPRAFAELVQLWLETTSDASATRDMAFPGKSKADLLAAIRQSDGDVRPFHEACVKLNARTQECLSRAERAERPHSALSFQWEELIDQLQSPTDTDTAADEEPTAADSFAGPIFDRVESDRRMAEPRVRNAQVEHLIGTLDSSTTTSTIGATTTTTTTTTYASKPSRPKPVTVQSSRSGRTTSRANSIRDNAYWNDKPHSFSKSRALYSGGSSSPASFDAERSAVSSDNEHGTTALPSYEREILQRRQDEVGQQSRQGEKRGQGMKIVSALRKNKKRTEHDGGSSSHAGNGTAWTP